MQRLLLFLLCCATALSLNAQTTVLENFDGTSVVTWEAVDGTYNGVVENPEDTTGINPSANVGSYTKADDRSYSLFIGTFDEPLDLSTNNRFSIQVYAGAATSFILKLEGPDGSIEAKRNIATANVWRTYTFDFSGTASQKPTRAILFFDDGVEESGDTYLFDNFKVSPAGPCAGTVVDATIIDDFECQRNATYAVPGFNDIMVIANPDKSGINTSDSVGQYTDQAGAFHALVIDYDDAIDLSVNNNICMKVWAPVTGEILFKLEGGSSPNKEVRVMVDEAETWTEVCADFSDQSNANHKKLVLFLNVGVDDAEGDIYYIDDITITPAPAAEAIEDFEDGAKLTWTAGGNNGTFNGPIDNPDTEGNSSATVGSYTRGPAPFATLNAMLPNGLDLSGNPQLNLDVWAPNDNTVVTMQLFSPTEGRKSADATAATGQSWQTLSFNFEEFADVTDFESISLIFAPNTTGTDTYYFDNLSQGESTVDACADVETDPRILDDFECQRNANYTVGGEWVSVVNNPDGGNDSPNKSTKVGAFDDQPGAFNALVIDFGGAIDLSLNNQLLVDIWAPTDGQILFKLEGGSAAAAEVFQDIPSTEEWNTYTVDLSPYQGMGYTRLVMFFGAGGDNAAVNTYYFDNLRLRRAPYVNSCISTFESADFTLAGWRYFANGDFEGNDFIISENPDQSGINTSETVGTFEEAPNGETFAGMYADLDAPLVLSSGQKMITMKVWMPVEGTVVFKLEQGIDGAPNSGDVPASYTTPREWQELTFDMSFLPDGARYNRVTLIPNSTEVPEAAQTHYFDDIAVGSGDCANTTGLFTPVRLDALRVFPNPISSQLTIENPNGAVRFTLTNMLGQPVKQLNVEGARTQVQWPLADLPAATYVLTAHDRSGLPLARSIVVKR
ncbi:hypothetical protein GGR26_002851 [Lewinella marina]|uniref:Secretion system C-terminal sorting domain-containing protein n=1 Tax=Neolewinella marina TaxID=438751 RepID=A0A2G0CBQ8_9BACT|nr:T9SS type A sorting domain-containing protein [Neolewinella marina]NJB87074.1 hypothetical protein [Neolewinella marina]PHK97392.1 hypothetical protein CGL56_16445 [Neolewinella marina]